MELYERVNTSFKLAERCERWDRHAKNIFQVASGGTHVFVAGAGSIPWDFGDSTKSLVDELNEVCLVQNPELCVAGDDRPMRARSIQEQVGFANKAPRPLAGKGYATIGDQPHPPRFDNI